MLPLVIGAVFIIVVAALCAVYVRQHIVHAPPDQAIVLTGRNIVIVDPESGEAENVGHRIVTSGSTFRIPMIERVDHLPLGEMSIQIDADDLRDAEGYARSLAVQVNCRVGHERPYLERALVRFLSMELPDIEAIAKTTIESRINNSLLTAELSDDSRWQELEPGIESAIREDLDRLGIVVDTLIFRRVPLISEPEHKVNGQAHSGSH